MGVDGNEEGRVGCLGAIRKVALRIVPSNRRDADKWRCNRENYTN